jgi:hypothetical protein
MIEVAAPASAQPRCDAAQAISPEILAAVVRFARGRVESFVETERVA